MMISQQADSNDLGWHTQCVKGPGNKVPIQYHQRNGSPTVK